MSMKDSKHLISRYSEQDYIRTYEDGRRKMLLSAKLMIFTKDVEIFLVMTCIYWMSLHLLEKLMCWYNESSVYSHRT